MREYIGFISNEYEVCIDENHPIVRCKDCSLQDDIKYCERLGFYVGDDGYCAWPKKSDPHTVEDVLCDFYAETHACTAEERDELIAKYASELQMREGAANDR